MQLSNAFSSSTSPAARVCSSKLTILSSCRGGRALTTTCAPTWMGPSFSTSLPTPAGPTSAPGSSGNSLSYLSLCSLSVTSATSDRVFNFFLSDSIELSSSVVRLKEDSTLLKSVSSSDELSLYEVLFLHSLYGLLPASLKVCSLSPLLGQLSSDR